MSNPILFSREVSPNEVLYLQLNRIFGDLSMQFIVEGVGSIGESEFRDAVRKASEACPGIRCILKNGRWEDSQIDPKIYWVDSIEIKTEDLFCDSVFYKKMNPQIHCAEIIFCKNPLKIIFRVFHGIMDGKGALTWIENIFKAMRNEAITEAISTDTESSFLETLSTSNERMKLSLNIKLREKKVSGLSRKTYWKKISLEGNHPGLIAKISKTCSNFFYSERNLFMIPVDLRRHKKNTNCTSNLTLPIFLETKKSEEWQTINSQFLFKLKNGSELNTYYANGRLLHHMPRFLDTIAIKSLRLIQKLTGKFFLGCIISHLGKVKMENLCAENFTANSFYSLGVVPPFAPFSLTILEDKGVTEIVLSSTEEKLLRHEAEQLLVEIKNYLLLTKNESIGF